MHCPYTHGFKLRKKMEIMATIKKDNNLKKKENKNQQLIFLFLIRNYYVRNSTKLFLKYVSKHIINEL